MEPVIGFALCGSFCTFSRVLDVLERLKTQYPGLFSAAMFSAATAADEAFPGPLSINTCRPQKLGSITPRQMLRQIPSRISFSMTAHCASENI